MRSGVQGDVALAWQNTDGAICRLKRSELLARVRQIAVSLYAAGFEPEDRIAIHLPMSVDKICLYLVLFGPAVSLLE